MKTTDLDLIEKWWQAKSRVDFHTYRKYINANKFKDGWFPRDLSKHLQQFMSDMVAGLRPILVISAPPQHGKQISDDTPVLTPQGFVTHGDLQRGDFVFDHDGNAVEVIGIIPQEQPCEYEVSFSNGERIKCHRNHEWTVTSKDWRGKYKTLETGEMLELGLWKGGRGKRGSRAKFKLPMVEALSPADAELPVDPYVLGAWLGDGTQTKPAITYKKDRCIVDMVCLRGYEETACCVHKDTGVKTSYFGGNLREDLITAGVFAKEYGVRKKHIPEKYLLASRSQRLDLLAGLVDTDGCYYRKNGRVMFSTTDLRLADTFCVLLSTFGITFSHVIVKPGTSTSGIIGKKDCHVIGFTPDFEIPCVVARKRNVKSAHNRKISIIDIVKIKPVKGKCIMVANKDGLYLVGKKLIPTHNSFAITDFIAWMLGQSPETNIIYSSFSEALGVRANREYQRSVTTPKYKAIFPGYSIGESNVIAQSGKLSRNNNLVENTAGGSFRNTTVNGAITGLGLDCGIIDDPIKGRKEANSKTVRDSVWDWFTDDFYSRFSENAGLLIIQTRWHIDDLTGRLSNHKPGLKLLKYPAINSKGEPLFPEQKSLEFLQERKETMTPANWQSVYQQNPIVSGGNIIKSDWWRWGEHRPALKYKFIVADTAQKTKTWNDYTDMQCWGVCFNGDLHLIDHFHARVESPDLRKIAAEFYHRHNTGEPMRGMWIEDKSSGSGLIQELERQKLKIEAIQRNTDKVYRAENIAPEIKAGRVWLYKDVKDVDIIVDEAASFPNGLNDDAIDCTISAIELEFLGNNNIDYSGLV